MKQLSPYRPGGTSRKNPPGWSFCPATHSPVRGIIILRTLLCVLLMISSVGCYKETKDIVIPEGADVIALSGRVIDPDGNPVSNVKVEVIFRCSGLWYTLDRVKAEAITDREGRYSLRLYQKEDELKSYSYAAYRVRVDRENQTGASFSSCAVYRPETLKTLGHDYLGDYILYGWKDIDIRASAPPKGYNKLYVYVQAPSDMYPLWEGQGETMVNLLSCESYGGTRSVIKHKLPVGPRLEIWGLWRDSLHLVEGSLPTDTAYFSVRNDCSLKIAVGADGSITIK